MVDFTAHHPAVIAAMLCALLPLLAFGLNITFFRHRPGVSAGIAICAAAGALICAISLLFTYTGSPFQFRAEWMVSGTLRIPVGILIDPNTLFMLMVVTGICFLVQIYSLGYMAGDTGFARYYAYMALFEWAMVALTLSPTLFQLYVFWELVGLSSYLLIGFWYEKFSAAEAGKKAFVMTRVGDVAFLLGLLIIIAQTGNLDISALNATEIAAHLSPGWVTLSTLLIFGGIVGKSAQFPLLTWLPDAMEGPTPVSALLHSATMVAAGVYLFARLFPLFAQSPITMTVCLTIGAISMLMAATMAMVSRDIKQVWAYSTISQLGFMIMGLGAGGYAAGSFHLTTHAGFKALLFLCSGVLIHTFHTNDINEIAQRGGKKLKIPMICLIIAAAALSGLPPFSGFFSKELIMGQLAALSNPGWLIAGFIGAFLTPYYAFRVIFTLLRPMPQESMIPQSYSVTNHMGKALYTAMALPLIALAVITCTLGFAESSFRHYVESTYAWMLPHTTVRHAWLPFTAVGLALLGIGLSFWEFGRRNALRIGFAERFQFTSRLFSQRWYLDRIYRMLLDHVIYGGISRLCTRNDQKIIDGIIDTFSQSTVNSGRMISRLHLAMIQPKLLAAFMVIVLLALYHFL